jgi:hypothetical protein
MGAFNPLPNPNMNVKKDMDDNTSHHSYTPPQISYANAANSQKGIYKANDTSSSVLSSYNDSYQPPIKLVNQPYYSNMGIGITGGDNKVMEKINYMIHLLEEQQNEKTNNITEEFILYTFLGVFIIFVVDSFARSGKYTR